MFPDFCKQTPFNEQKDSMCNKAYIIKILQGYKCFHFMFHTFDLVHVLCMEFTADELLNILNIFFKKISECLRR